MNAAVGKARGVLRAQPMPGAFEHARVAPPDSVCGLVEHYWMVRWDLGAHPPQQRQTLPHPNVHLVIERGRTRVFGVHTARFTRVLEGAGCVFGVKFRAGGFRPFLGRAVATLTERSLSPSEVFGSSATTLEDDVLGATDEHAMAAIATRFLVAHLPPADANVDRVARIVADIADDRELSRVEQLVERTAINKRALQRLFNDYVGVSPKWVIGRYRLHEALEQLVDGAPPDWVALALQLGYFDQAHFIRDFRQLIGQTPTEYLRTRSALD
jgi:AraC-like DNA-binding protein